MPSVRATLYSEYATSSGLSISVTPILVTAALLRLLIVAAILLRFPSNWFFRSQGELGFLAHSLVSGHGFSSPFGGSTGPTAFLAPGYPLLIAAVFYLFGSFTPGSALAIMLLQTLFGVLTIRLILHIARQEFGSLAARIAGWFWAIGLPFLWLPIIFWDTSLSILLLTLALALCLRTARTPTLANWLILGLAGAFSLLINPSFSLTFLGLFLWTILRTRPPLHRPALAILLLLVLYSPWPIRNARTMHAFIALRSNLGFELWKGNRPGACSVDDASLYPVFNRAEYASYATQGEVAYMQGKSTLAREYIVSHPADFLRLSAGRFLRFWSGTGTQQPSLLLASVEVLTTILALAGLALLIRSGRLPLAMLFIIPLTLFPLPFYMTHAELRFRLLIEPLTTLLAAHVLARIFRRESNQPQTRPISAGPRS